MELEKKIETVIEILNEIAQDVKKDAIMQTSKADWPDDMLLTYDEALAAVGVSTLPGFRNYHIAPVSGKGKTSLYLWRDVKQAILHRKNKKEKAL